MGKENNSFSVSVVYLLAVLASLPCLRILLCVVFIDFLPFLFLRLFDVDRFLFFFFALWVLGIIRRFPRFLWPLVAYRASHYLLCI